MYILCAYTQNNCSTNIYSDIILIRLNILLISETELIFGTECTFTYFHNLVYFGMLVQYFILNPRL